MINKTWFTLLLAIAILLMTLAANCFLKYLWWAACYSAWSGIVKMADQWKAAGFRASFNLWSFVSLDFGGAVLLFTVLRLPSSDGMAFLKPASRAILVLFLTIFITALLALVLSWVKQGIR